MRLGISVLYWPWFSLEDQLDLAKLADQSGLDSVWVAESYGQEAVAMLGAIAANTHRVELGAGIFQIPARQPTTAAMAASTLQQISGGRMRVGFGLSGPQVSEGWYGVPFESPLKRTEEYVAIVRRALSGEKVEHDGAHWQLPSTGGTGLGKPLRMIQAPSASPPIYLAVSGPATVRQAGRIADGWLPFLYVPERADELNRPLLEGLAVEGRQRCDVAITPLAFAALAEDRDSARDALRPVLAMYLGGMGAKGKNFYVDLATRWGFGSAAERCQDLFLSGDVTSAAQSLPPELIDVFAIAATPATLDAELARFREAGVDELVIAPFGDSFELVRLLGESREEER